MFTIGTLMRYFIFFVSLLLCLCMYGYTQIPADKDALLNAEGMGQASYAEMNGYPGPKHVLDLADKLQLSEAQKKSVKQIYNDMAARAKELAQRIISLEEELNKAFSENLVTERSVREDAEQIGRLRGRLRAVHLAAHLKTRGILTDKQVETYMKMRKEEKK
jgi:Spy/CpxP family protein refolding chaperone